MLAATILSAQSTDACANMETPGLFAAYPDAALLAAANPEHVKSSSAPPGSSATRA